MSPLSLRRHRAERLLREQFEGLRGRVLASVRGRLRASGISLDRGDLEACYAMAWQGLYTAVLEGQEIASPAGWLVLVTFRRAIEEHRARARAGCAGELSLNGAGAPTGVASEVAEPAALAAERDFAAELDDRVRLRQLFEGLRGRLHGREREAAALCYLQGLSRSEAAARMGVSEARMRKLMEGRGPGRPGVAGKVGALVATIRDGDWCEEQGSLMRALAYGVLDPDGERYRLALVHHSQCSACRAYVVSLRGLAAALPPVFLPWALGAEVLTRAGEGLHAGGAAAAAGRGGGGSAGGAGASGAGGGTSAGVQAGRGLGGALSASGAAGAGGATGGGWLLGAGPLGAKLAAGCLLALGVGAGCAALEGGGRVRAGRHGHHHAARPGAAASAGAPTGYPLGDLAGGVGRSLSAIARGDADSPVPLTPSARASREFGPEQALASDVAGAAASGAVSSSSSQAPTARSASSGSGSLSAGPGSSADESGRGDVAAPAGGESASQSSAGDSTAAEREFSPG
jgi:DNA-directed RNA polymerase specialized sigma24 family protein